MTHAFLSALGSVEVIQRCTKVSFNSRKMAMKVARGKMKQPVDPVGVIACGDGTLKAYRCSICAGWHVGHRRM